MTFQNPYCLNYMGSKSTCIYCSDGTAPTIVRGHGHDMHVIVFPEKKKSPLVRHKSAARSATSVVDRCGNNWKNGKGGCGILMMSEVSPCVATMFQPMVLLEKKK